MLLLVFGAKVATTRRTNELQRCNEAQRYKDNVFGKWQCSNFYSAKNSFIRSALRLRFIQPVLGEVMKLGGAKVPGHGVVVSTSSVYTAAR